MPRIEWTRKETQAIEEALADLDSGPIPSRPVSQLSSMRKRGEGNWDDQGHWTGALNPPSPMSSGELPTSRGIRPVMGPPLAAAARVTSV